MQNAEDKRQSGVCTKSASGGFEAQDVSYLKRHLTTWPHETLYGRFEEQKKRDLEQAYQKMTATEKESFKQKMVEINEAGTDEGQSPPSTPTPV